MDKLLSDSAKTEISNKVMDILRAYQILDQQSDEWVWCPSQLLALMPHLCVTFSTT